MVMVDLDYDGDVFRLGQVFWGEDLLKDAGGLEAAESLEVRIEERFHGQKNDGDPVRQVREREDPGLREK